MKSAGQRASAIRRLASLVLTALCPHTQAQQLGGGKLPLIGYIAGSNAPTAAIPDTNGDAFRQGLRDLGYVEGKDIDLVYRYADGSEDRARNLITELLERKIDVLVSPYRPVIRMAKHATTTTPIVMVITGDPVADGLVHSMARPGGNITGITRLTRDLTGKTIELLQEMMPGLVRGGVLFNPDATTANSTLKDYETAAQRLKISLRPLGVRNSNPDLEEVFRAAANERLTALFTIRAPVLINNRRRIAELAIQNRMASMSEGSIFVDAGWPCLLFNRRS